MGFHSIKSGTPRQRQLGLKDETSYSGIIQAGIGDQYQGTAMPDQHFRGKRLLRAVDVVLRPGTVAVCRTTPSWPPIVRRLDESCIGSATALGMQSGWVKGCLDPVA
jgi:hypothetical protein